MAELNQRRIKSAIALFENEGIKMTRDAGGITDLREASDWQSIKKQGPQS